MFRIKNILIALCVSLIAACNSGGESKATSSGNAINPDVVNNPATASSEKGTKNVPAFQFADESHDFGTITQGKKVSFAFRFTNTGKSDLVISTASGSCGCTVPEYPKGPTAPGKEGIINVTFNSEGKEGKQEKTVTLIANTIPNTKVLTITGNVIVKK